jgi:hypothetical protein
MWEKPTGMMFGLALVIDMSRKNRFLENQFCRKEGAAQKGCEITSKLRLQIIFYLFNVF